MIKIFEPSNVTDEEPINQWNGYRPAIGLADSTNGSVSGGISGTQAALDQTARQELNRLIQALFLRQGGSRLVAFSAVQSGAGCSWLVARIAELLENAGVGTVCVVDANFSSPVLHGSHTDNGFGLSDALLGVNPIGAYVQAIGDHLYLLSSGSMCTKAEPLLASTAFRARVEELRAKFDYVLFDTPPLDSRSDALAVGGRTDGLALVVEADSTHRETARKAVRDVTAANVRILGLLLNKRTYPIPEALYKKF